MFMQTIDYVGFTKKRALVYENIGYRDSPKGFVSCSMFTLSQHNLCCNAKARVNNAYKKGTSLTR